MPSADPPVVIPQHQTAVVAQGPGRLVIQHDAPIPSLTPEMVIVRTAAVAINPVDAKMLDYSPHLGAIQGYVCFKFSGLFAADRRQDSEKNRKTDPSECT